MTARLLDSLRRPLASSPRRTDAVLAAVFATVSLVQVLVEPIAPRPLGVLLALALTVPIAFRRRHPVAATVAGTLLWVVPTDGYLLVGYVAALLLLYSLAAEVGDLRVVAAVVVYVLGVSVVGLGQGDGTISEWLGGFMVVLAPALVGRLMRRQHEQSRRLEQLNRELTRERERAEQRAVDEERARIARELHDVVAHGIGVIAVQADAAEAALERDPARAEAPLRTIRGSARDALAEMRRMLGVLRAGGDGDGRAPQPGLGELADLLVQARAAGVPAELTVEGDPRPLSPSLDLTAYRIVQEALTNAGKHAPGARVAIAVSWTGSQLEIAVRDAGPGPSANGERNRGHGLVGMRERVRIHGGTLRAGRSDGGGFEVVARLPIEDRP